MKLYEINNEILRLADQIEVDEDTGEIKGNADELFNQLDALQMERQSVLEYLAKLVLNTRSEASSLKAEEQRLKERRVRLEKKTGRLLAVLDRECAGEKTDLGVATFAYRKTSHVEIADSAMAVSWLKSNNYTSCYRVPEPEISKSEVKKLINSGTEVPGCAVIEDRSYSLK